MITSILGQRLQLFSQMVPSHRNKSPYHAFSCLRPVTLVASVGQPKLQHSTLLTRATLELVAALRRYHTLALWERLIPSQKLKRTKLTMIRSYTGI